MIYFRMGTPGSGMTLDVAGGQLVHAAQALHANRVDKLSMGVPTYPLSPSYRSSGSRRVFEAPRAERRGAKRR